MSQANTTTTRSPEDAAKRARSAPSPYKLVTIEKTVGPQSEGGESWYNYVLDNGRSKIVGTHRGSLKSVTAYANQCASELNARTLSCVSVWSPRGKKAT